MFLVILKASDVRNYGQSWYSQKLEAWLGESLVSEHYDSNHKSNMVYYTNVLSRLVNANSGIGAILKFKKWQRKKKMAMRPKR